MYILGIYKKFLEMKRKEEKENLELTFTQN